jgi:hypothetical protein
MRCRRWAPAGVVLALQARVAREWALSEVDTKSVCRGRCVIYGDLRAPNARSMRLIRIVASILSSGH